VVSQEDSVTDILPKRCGIPLWWVLLASAVAGAALAILFPAMSRCFQHRERVIIYCAQDQTYAEPILHQFEEETGIRVKAVYDSEAVKTVGLANPLLAERKHPQCDVFWGNEEMRTRQLAAFDVWETNGFASFGARARCLVINTNIYHPVPEMVGMRFTASPTPSDKSGTMWKSSLLDVPSMPASLLDLTNAAWRGRVALAFPQFGTTATHFHVLRQYWGDQLWRQWCRGLVANEARVVDGNSTVVKLVARGEAWIGLTDTDDVAAGVREGMPVAVGPDLPEMRLIIPNTVALVRGAPHAENALKLAEFLQRPDTVQILLDAGAIQYDEIPAANASGLCPDWDRLLAELESTTEVLNEVFLR